MPKAFYAPTHQELADAVPHLEEEWRMFCHAVVWLVWLEDNPDWKPYPNRPGFETANVQSFAVQFRNFRSFFFDSQKENDDVQARMYCPSWAPQKKPLLEKWIKRSNKQVNHVTFERAKTAPEDFRWPFVRIFEALSEVCADWQRVQNWGPIDIGKVPDVLIPATPSPPSRPSFQGGRSMLPELVNMTSATTGPDITRVNFLSDGDK